MIAKIHEIKLTVGSGENYFSMEKGSFNYEEKIENKSSCTLVNTDKTAEGTSLYFRDENERTYQIDIVGDESKVELKLVGDIPEDVNRFWLTFKTNSTEHIYGCGETYSEIDLKGQKVRIWVAEHQNAKRISDKIIREKLSGKDMNYKLSFEEYESYYAQPTFTSSDKYYVHVDTNRYSVFDFTNPDETVIYLQERPHIFIESATSFTELSKKLSDRLGRQHRLPDWLYDGGILAMQDWKFDGEETASAFDGVGNIERKVKKAKDAGAEVIGVWCQDWCGCRCTAFGYQVMWNWSYDRDKYKELPSKIKEWKEQGFRFLGYINPFLAIEKELYREAHEKGYLVKNDAGEDYLVTITTFPAAMIDFTNPAAYEWYKDIIKKNMIGIGMSGWMADFGEYLPEDAVLYDGDARELHNRWPAIWAKLNYEAIEEEGKLDEVFFFTRAGHTGTVAYSTMMWTGDQHVDFSIDDGIGSVIPAHLSLAMSGFGISHSDVGGYTTIEHMTRSKELMLRWIELNAFTPLFRGHEGNQPGRNVQFDYDDETLNHIGKYTGIHRRLKPYIKSLVEETVTNGTPVMRPLFYHYDEKPAYVETSEYLLGEDLLVAPVLEEKAVTRKVYLPEDKWINVYTNEEYEGGTYEVDAPIGKPPVFVRSESTFKQELIKAINE